MFAYCRNNPASRKDASGTEDVCVEDFNEDDNPLNDVGNPTGGGGGSNGTAKAPSGSGGGSNGTAKAPSGSGGGSNGIAKTPSGSSKPAGTPSSKPSGSNTSSVPKKAWDTLDYLKNNKWTPQKNYKGGSQYANDGRNGSAKLPDSGRPYYEYDINPKAKYVGRGTERIVTDKNGMSWYTPDHYKSFIRME